MLCSMRIEEGGEGVIQYDKFCTSSNSPYSVAITRPYAVCHRQSYCSLNYHTTLIHLINLQISHFAQAYRFHDLQIGDVHGGVRADRAQQHGSTRVEVVGTPNLHAPISDIILESYYAAIPILDVNLQCSISLRVELFEDDR